MTTTNIEMASFRLKPEIEETVFVAASDRFQREFLNGAPGFLSRELLRGADGVYLDLIHWRSKEDAEAMMKTAATSPDCAAYFALMDLQGAEMRHFESLAVYQGL
ncbi:heme-degrading monooxygenase HmoA [Rhizobium sp. SG_E_25_P2]|uniref:antibiotic biosynthesis monooxygenase family protein n=1 Tax=Rhizobium sp. SG_E_25_P2 TaxID=2879942 RepID=UPI002474DA9D|nr:antibiotic biosynthesis monooxygenase [Rhizobium sp. SG_E_25_P2]MDH6267726.1 heme-degrading monooxygenase HmoA [Rhizobium sp. SG_E_25_P2]